MTRTMFTTIVPPKDDPAVQARGRELQAARTALSEIERRARELEVERESSDELRVLTAALETRRLGQQYIAAKADCSERSTPTMQRFSRPNSLAEALARALSRGGAQIFDVAGRRGAGRERRDAGSASGGGTGRGARGAAPCAALDRGGDCPSRPRRPPGAELMPLGV